MLRNVHCSVALIIVSHYLWILPVLLFQLIPSADAFTTSTSKTAPTTIMNMQSTTMTSSSSKYTLRPYDPNNPHDVTTLREICANVYGGGDYLPQMAASYVADESCSFLALTAPQSQSEGSTSQSKSEERDTILAVANYKRLPAQNSAWIEAVRTHPEYRNRGLASSLLSSLVDMALKESAENNKERNNNLRQDDKSPTNILTCTIQSNKGMQRALEKVGFVQCNTICTLSFAKLKELPGWANDNAAAATTKDATTRTSLHNGTPLKEIAQPLLTALDLNHKVSSEAKVVPSLCWSTIDTEEELLSHLVQLKELSGTSGYLPGLYEYIVPGPNRLDLKQSLQQGLVLTLDLNLWEKERSTCENHDGNISIKTEADHRAIVAFTIDERISSLKSKWVCSIVATSHMAFEAAVWHACNSSDVARRMRLLSHGVFNAVDGDDDTAIGAEREYGDKMEREHLPYPFCLSFDDSLPLTPGSLAHSLPLVTDECVVFSYKHDRMHKNQSLD